MKIEKLTITAQELNQAVGDFLKTNGISLPVYEIEKDYRSSGSYVVTFKENPIFTYKVSPEDRTNEIVVTQIPLQAT